MNNAIVIIFGVLSAMLAIAMGVLAYICIAESVSVECAVIAIIMSIVSVVCAIGNFQRIEKRK